MQSPSPLDRRQFTSLCAWGGIAAATCAPSLLEAAPASRLMNGLRTRFGRQGTGKDAPRAPKLKKAVKDFLGAVPARDQVTLLGFNDSVFALTRKTTDPAERVKSVDRLAPWGATALYDVIVRATDMLGKQVGRKALVVFSDGEDQGSHVSIDDVERRLQASDVTLYMIAQGRGISQDYLKKTMQRLVTPTGGRVLLTENIDQLHGAFEELLDELSNQYLLGYQPGNPARDDTWREIGRAHV